MAAANCENRADEVDMLLASIGPGEVRTLFVESTGAAMDRLRAHARATGRPTVVHCWRRLPDVHKVVDETVAAVARAALDAWPDWYVGAAVHFVSGNGTEAAAVNGAARRAVLASLRGVNAAWLRAAATRCAERRVRCSPISPRPCRRVSSRSRCPRAGQSSRWFSTLNQKPGKRALRLRGLRVCARSPTRPPGSPRKRVRASWRSFRRASSAARPRLHHVRGVPPRTPCRRGGSGGPGSPDDDSLADPRSPASGEPRGMRSRRMVGG
jgi:hypothetical protein